MQKLWCCQIPRNQTVLGHRDMMICKHAVVQSGSCNTTGFIWTSFQPCFQTEKASGPPGWAPILLTPNILLSFPGQTRNKLPLHLLLPMSITQPNLRLALTGRDPSLKCPYLSPWERGSERERCQHRSREDILEEGEENTFLSQISKCLCPVPTSDWHTCKCVYMCSCTQ